MPAADYSRTKKGMRNSAVALSLQIVSLLLGFFTRKIFLDNLGTEIVGLNTTANSILGFLNIAELGIGTAISVTLYKPLFDSDRTTIKEIVALQGWLYKRVAIFVLTGSLLLLPFFPKIFAKMELPIWYAIASYSAYLFSSMLGYFVNYKQIVLSADQNEYKIQLCCKATGILKIVAQAFAVKYLDHAFIWWVVLEILFAILSSLILNHTIYSTYPFLKEDVLNKSLLSKKYPDIVRKVKQLFLHKIASFVVTQTSPIIIYAYASLTLVAYYGNYMIIISNLSLLLVALFNSTGASIGNMVAEGDNRLIIKVFRELFSSRFLLVFTCSLSIYFLADPFISIWIGPDYLLDKVTLILMIIIFYIGSLRTVVESYLNAYGLFQDIWAPITEAIINLGCSILLGHFFGLHGILLGVIISLLLIISIWKPVFLFKYGLKKPVISYIKLYLRHIIPAIVTTIVIFFIKKAISIDPYQSIWSFLEYACIIFGSTFITLYGLLYIAEEGMRNFSHRIMKFSKYRH